MILGKTPSNYYLSCPFVIQIIYFAYTSYALEYTYGNFALFSTG